MVPKFRGWDRKNHVMYDFMMMCFNVNLKNVLYRNNLTDFDVDMYTGLKDANGKEIYDNDIVEVVSQYWGQLGNRYKVKFNKGAFSVKYDLLAEIRASILVIGNVHTNPELLEDK